MSCYCSVSYIFSSSEHLFTDHFFHRSFPYYEDFENKSNYYTLNKHAFSSARIYSVHANTNYKGLILKGSNQTNKWVEPADNYTSTQVWEENPNNIASMNFNVDASIFGLILKFDLKQTYKTNPQNCFLRVLVNGKEIKDINGKEYINPVTNNNVFKRQVYDLSPFTGDKIKMTLQSLCKSDEDCVFIEYLSFDNPDNVSKIDNND